MKKILIGVFSLCLVFGFGSCKSKQSAYKAAYEKAQQKEVEEQEEEEEEEEPVQKTVTRPVTTETFKKESLTAINGDLKMYSVVIGSFGKKTGAESIKQQYDAKGFNCVIALNPAGLHRVIVGTFNTKNEAADLRDVMRNKYGVHDAWLLEKK